MDVGCQHKLMEDFFSIFTQKLTSGFLNNTNLNPTKRAQPISKPRIVTELVK